MKKPFLLIILVMLFVKIPFLNAECNELNNLVNKEKFVYITHMGGEDTPYIFIEVYNIFYPYLYVVIEEDNSNTKTRYDSDDVPNNYLSIKYTNIERSTNYKIKVYGDMQGCQDELLKTVEFNTPTKNKYYNEVVCTNNRSYEKCSFFADNNNITLEELEKEINEYVKENNINDNQEKENIKENTFLKNIFKNINFKLILYIIVPVLIIGVFFAIRIIFLKKERKQ